VDKKLTYNDLEQKIKALEESALEAHLLQEALRESEARHRQREERYRNILDHMEEAYYEVDLKGNLTFFNTTAVTNLGYTDKVMMGLNYHEYVDKDCKQKVSEAFHKVFLTGESIKGVDWELITQESGKIPVESSISLLRDTQGNPIGFRGIIRDITERKRAEEALHESEVKFRSLTETAQDAIVTINMNGIITYANPAAKELATGMAVVGMALKDFLPPDSAEHHLGILKLITSGFSETLSYESKIMRPQDDCPLYFDVKSSTLLNRGEPSGVLFVARDATERKRTEAEIRMMAIIDTLTGLYNRRGFIALAEQQMKTAVRIDKKLLLFFIDLDGLKFINDTWGHEEGDRALKRTSIILKNTFRESDVISRLGGDEFAALVTDSAELPEVILKRLQSRTDDENAASDLPYQISMSIGVADYDPSVPCSIHELMSLADQLMYNQKKGKKQMGKYPV
jgi:diguanylate cyclase (GGDEF)-like protein/PAS domain S-box-containing protein